MTPDFRRLARIASLSFALLIAACHFGPSLAEFPVASNASGAGVRFPRGESKVSGELVAVRDSALVVRDGSRLVIVRWARIRDLAVEHVGLFELRGRRPNDSVAERLRLLSRFPQDMTPEVERRMLETLGRESIEVDR